MKEKDGDVIIKICDKTRCASHRGSKPHRVADVGGFTTCTESFRDLHDVSVQEARHKARWTKNVINWVFELSWRNSQNVPAVSYDACNILFVFNRRSTKIMTRPAEHHNFSLFHSPVPFWNIIGILYKSQCNFIMRKCDVMQTYLICFHLFKKFDETLLEVSSFTYFITQEFIRYLFQVYLRNNIVII